MKRGEVEMGGSREMEWREEMGGERRSGDGWIKRGGVEMGG